MKPITVKGQPLAEGRLPALCIPLVARTVEALRAEAAAAANLSPDLIEWRVDFFEGLARTQDVVALAAEVRRTTGVPLLFTRRSSREGGQPIALTEPQVVDLYKAVCEAQAADIVDWEMAAQRDHVEAVREAARAAGVTLLLSFHDFGGTPALPQMLERFRQAQALGGDVGKLAVMPKTRADVLALLQATLQASQELAIPVAGMSMGALGAVTRLCGGEFGSALTFALGQAASAPGQMPVDDLRQALAVLRRGSGAG